MRKLLLKKSEETKKVTKTKKLVNKISTVVISVAFLVVLFALLSLTVQTLGGKKPSIFGYKLYFVLTESMVPTLEPNEIILSQVIENEDDAKNTLKDGDIITFVAEYGMQKGMTITHRILVGPHYDESYDMYVVTTKGDNVNATVDPPVPLANVQAIMIKKVGGITTLYNFFSSTKGIVTILVVPLIFILGTLIWRLISVIKAPASAAKTQDNEETDIEELKRKAVEEYLANEKRKKEIAEQAVKDYIESQKQGGNNDTQV